MPVRATKALPAQSRLSGIPFKALPVDVTNYRRPSPAVVDVVERVRGEFVEMRGFSPTVDQAARLFQINRDECGRILKALVDQGFLRQTEDGRFRLPSQH